MYGSFHQEWLIYQEVDCKIAFKKFVLPHTQLDQENCHWMTDENPTTVNWKIARETYLTCCIGSRNIHSIMTNRNVDRGLGDARLANVRSPKIAFILIDSKSRPCKIVEKMRGRVANVSHGLIFAKIFAYVSLVFLSLCNNMPAVTIRLLSRILWSSKNIISLSRTKDPRFSATYVYSKNEIRENLCTRQQAQNLSPINATCHPLLLFILFFENVIKTGGACLLVFENRPWRI